MADREALGKIGVAFGLATATVVMIGAFVVTGHLSDQTRLDSLVRVGAVTTSATR